MLKIEQYYHIQDKLYLFKKEVFCYNLIQLDRGKSKRKNDLLLYILYCKEKKP